MFDSHKLKNYLPQKLDTDSYQRMFNEYTELQDPTSWNSAVVMLLKDDEVIFIQRSWDVPRHRGQVASFGGMREAGENHPVDVATREFEEETSLSATKLDFLGIIPPVLTGSSVPVVPVIAKSDHSWKELEQMKSNGEWDVCFSVKLGFLLDLNAWSYANRIGTETNGSLLYRTLLREECRFIAGEEGALRNYIHLWGVTARTTWNMLRLMAHSQK